MSEAGATAAHDAHAEHHELGFIRTYIFSTDHKMIGRQFIFASILMLIVGGLLAMMMRWELAWPETPVPFTSWISEPFMYPADEDSTVGAVEGLSDTVRGDHLSGRRTLPNPWALWAGRIWTLPFTTPVLPCTRRYESFVVMPFMVGGFGKITSFH